MPIGSPGRLTCRAATTLIGDDVLLVNHNLYMLIGSAPLTGFASSNGSHRTGQIVSMRAMPGSNPFNRAQSGIVHCVV